MKIAIINLTGGGMSGGYKKYLQNVLPRMAAHSDVEALLCASPKSLNVKDWFGPLSNVEFVNCKHFRFMRNNLDQELRQRLEKFLPDVIYLPTERSFRFNKVPIVNMLQNMAPFATNIDGNPFSERVKQWIQAVDARKAIKKSDRVIAISEFVSYFLVQKWNIPLGKIGLVRHGISQVQNKEVESPTLIPKDWKGRFLFTAGSIRPARGLEDLLYAIKHLSENSFDIPNLVIAGETTQNMARYRKRLEDWIRANNLTPKVYWAESLSEKEMAWCYQNCQAFVMTSRVESFGMIAGEAISHGAICISADNPCLPEIFGDAAIYYPPKDGKVLAEAIKTVFAWNDNQLKAMSDKAKKRASEFSWDVCAEKTVTEMQKAVIRKAEKGTGKRDGSINGSIK